MVISVEGGPDDSLTAAAARRQWLSASSCTLSRRTPSLPSGQPPDASAIVEASPRTQPEDMGGARRGRPGRRLLPQLDTGEERGVARSPGRVLAVGDGQRRLERLPPPHRSES